MVPHLYSYSKERAVKVDRNMREQTCFVVAALLCAALGAPFPATQCPHDCECSTQHQQPHGQLEARCNSLMFLENLQPEQLNAITRLDLSHLNLTKVGHNLKKLHGLKSINLSQNNLRHIADLSTFPKLTHVNLRGNHIKHFTASDLPKHVQYVDLSGNYLVEFPEGLLQKAKTLRELNIADNPFACSCDIKNKCDAIAAVGVVLVKPVTCHSYENDQGRLLHVNTLNCTHTPTDNNNNNDLDRMQGDQPEGSGEEDEPSQEDNDIFGTADTAKKLHDIESEELLPTAQANGDAKTDDEEEYEETEGSGDPFEEEEEGSGDEFAAVVPTQETRLKACNFDCPSTPFTIEDDNNGTNTTEPDPSLFDEFNHAVKDIFAEPDPTEDASNETEIVEAPMKEVVVEKSGAGRSSDAIGITFTDEKEKMHEAVSVAESEEINEARPFGLSNNMIIVIALIIIMVCIVVYSVLVKKRKGRRSAAPPVIEHEMKPLNAKPTNGSSNGTNGAQPEKVPLMNGQNGNMNGKPVDDNDDEPVVRKRNEELESRPPRRSDDDIDGKPAVDADDDDEPYLRKKHRDDDKLLPETHRVTVQAKELTTPKTPMLVNRLRSQDGQIITTPEPDQRL